MTGTHASYGLGRVQTGEYDVIWTPRGTPLPRGIVLSHGAGSNAQGFTDPTNTGAFPFAQELAQAGFVVIAGDFAGLTFGNDIGVARLEAARALLGNYVSKPDKAIFVGFSHGGLCSLNYCRANPSKVAALGLASPVADLDDLRARNVFGYQSSIDAAWGVTFPAALPTRANPSNQANASLIASSGAPVRTWYSTADTAVPAVTQTTLAARIGPTASAYITSSSQDHADMLLALIPPTNMIPFLVSAAN